MSFPLFFFVHFPILKASLICLNWWGKKNIGKKNLPTDLSHLMRSEWRLCCIFVSCGRYNKSWWCYSETSISMSRGFTLATCWLGQHANIGWDSIVINIGHWLVTSALLCRPTNSPSPTNLFRDGVAGRCKQVTPACRARPTNSPSRPARRRCHVDQTY